MRPMAQRVTAVMPLNTDRRTNFVQMSIWMFWLSVTSNPAGRAGVEQALQSRRPGAVELAEEQMIERRVADRARLGDDGGDVDRAAGRVLAADRLGDDLDAVDAVLERDDRCFGSDERRQQRWSRPRRRRASP